MADDDVDTDDSNLSASESYHLGSNQYAQRVGDESSRFADWLQEGSFVKANSFWAEVDAILLRTYIEEHPDSDLSEKLLDRSKNRSQLLGKGNTSEFHLLSGSAYRWFDHAALSLFVRNRGFTVVSTTGGAHNTGSAHYKGQANDVRTRGKSPADVEKFIREARTLGIWVRDERIRPPRQAVWSGPHLHIDTLGPAGGRLTLERPTLLSDQLFGPSPNEFVGDGGSAEVAPDTSPKLPPLQTSPAPTNREPPTLSSP